MANMSYCRFQNTRRDLDDCKYALEELCSGGDDALSAEELRAAKQMARTCRDFLQLLADFRSCQLEDLTDEAIDEALDEINAGAEEEEEDEEDEE